MRARNTLHHHTHALHSTTYSVIEMHIVYATHCLDNTQQFLLVILLLPGFIAFGIV